MIPSTEYFQEKAQKLRDTIIKLKKDGAHLSDIEYQKGARDMLYEIAKSYGIEIKLESDTESVE